MPRDATYVALLLRKVSVDFLSESAVQYTISGWASKEVIEVTDKKRHAILHCDFSLRGKIRRACSVHVTLAVKI